MKKNLLSLTSFMIFISLITDIAYGYTTTNNTDQEISFFSSLMKFIGFLVIFAIVIFLAYYTTRIVAAKSNQSMKSGNMEIIDFLSLSSSSKIMMVRIERQVYIIGLSGNNITSLDKLDYEQLDIKSRNLYSNDFEAQLKKFINKEKISELKDKFSKKRDDI